MSQRKHRSRQWKRQDAALKKDIEPRVGRVVRRVKLPADDLLQEGYLAIWKLSPETVRQAEDPILLQRQTAEAAMHRFARRWKKGGKAKVISLDEYVRKQEPDSEWTEDEWGAPVAPRRKAA